MNTDHSLKGPASSARLETATPSSTGNNTSDTGTRCGKPERPIAPMRPLARNSQGLVATQEASADVQKTNPAATSNSQAQQHQQQTQQQQQQQQQQRKLSRSSSLSSLPPLPGHASFAPLSPTHEDSAMDSPLSASDYDSQRESEADEDYRHHHSQDQDQEHDLEQEQEQLRARRRRKSRRHMISSSSSTSASSPSFSSPHRRRSMTELIEVMHTRKAAIHHMQLSQNSSSSNSNSPHRPRLTEEQQRRRRASQERGRRFLSPCAPRNSIVAADDLRSQSSHTLGCAPTRRSLPTETSLRQMALTRNLRPHAQGYGTDTGSSTNSSRDTSPYLARRGSLAANKQPPHPDDVSAPPGRIVGIVGMGTGPRNGPGRGSTEYLHRPANLAREEEGAPLYRTNSLPLIEPIGAPRDGPLKRNYSNESSPTETLRHPSHASILQAGAREVGDLAPRLSIQERRRHSHKKNKKREHRRSSSKKPPALAVESTIANNNRVGDASPRAQHQRSPDRYRDKRPSAARSRGSSTSSSPRDLLSDEEFPWPPQHEQQQRQQQLQAPREKSKRKNKGQSRSASRYITYADLKPLHPRHGKADGRRRPLPRFIRSIARESGNVRVLRVGGGYVILCDDWLQFFADAPSDSAHEDDIIPSGQSVLRNADGTFSLEDGTMLVEDDSGSDDDGDENDEAGLMSDGVLSEATALGTDHDDSTASETMASDGADGSQNADPSWEYEAEIYQVAEDGAKDLHDGTVVHPDGRITMSDGTELPSEAALNLAKTRKSIGDSSMLDEGAEAAIDDFLDSYEDAEGEAEGDDLVDREITPFVAADGSIVDPYGHDDDDDDNKSEDEDELALVFSDGEGENDDADGLLQDSTSSTSSTTKGGLKPRPPSTSADDANQKRPPRRKRSLPVLPDSDDAPPSSTRSSGNVLEAIMEQAAEGDAQPTTALDYLSRYCIISEEKAKLYGNVFEALDTDSNGVLSFVEMEFGMKTVNKNVISLKEMEYVTAVLQVKEEETKPSSQGITPRMFALICALSERVVGLDMFVKNLINTMDEAALKKKLVGCKSLFYILDEQRKGVISVEDMKNELIAGRISKEHEALILEKLTAEGQECVFFLDFLKYLPLFVEIHDSINRNPFETTRDK